MPTPDPDILPDLTDQEVTSLEDIIISLLKTKSGIPINDVFIVSTNPGCWSHEITLNLEANLIDHLIKTQSL